MIIDKSKYTKQDLEILTNSKYEKKVDNTDFSNVIVKKPWGYEYLLFENNDIAIWILHIKASHKTSMHCHPNKNTSLICLSGEVVCTTLDNKYIFDELNGIYLGKKVFHQTLNESLYEAIVIEIESPVDKFDLLRMQDNYGRRGKSYEHRDNYEIKEGLTLADIVNTPFIKQFGNVKLELGFAKNKEELLILCKENSDKIIATVLNRHIWSASGNKEFEVGQLIILNDDVLNKYNINDNFTYLIISKE
jgi:mannose-6-phosphate isomerase-like protein (cupin superfamily)